MNLGFKGYTGSGIPESFSISMTSLPSPDLSRPALRKLLRQRRRALTPVQQRQAARRLYRQLAQNPLFRRARHVALYLPSDGEIDPRPLLEEAQRRGKATYLPVLSRWPRTAMIFQRVGHGETWVRNRFGIAEPRPDRRLGRPSWALGLILMPLVGFDPQGGRLGMGKGFYDRNLAYLARRRQWHSPQLIGCAHECQKVERLALAAWDVPMAAVVSDGGWYGRPGGKG